MANGIDKAFMEQLKSKTDIVQVIGSYIPIKKNGGNHWACCPFHHERTPSFSINQDGQFYHCFGCHTGGDVIKFVQEYESLTFIDAVRLLAEKAGME
ncbi:MAG: DNA primase, partial [Clostridia bacterium]|nr:DNA primase [Clostridia bacterium]